MLLLQRSGEHAKGNPRQSHVAIAAPEGDERRPIIRAEAHMLQGQTGSRSRILHCPADLIAPAISMMPVFHEVSRAERPSQQGRKTTLVAHALLRAASSLYSTLLRPGAASVGKSADAARKSACATFASQRTRSIFHEISRAAGPSQQTGLTANFRQRAPETHVRLVSPR